MEGWVGLGDRLHVEVVYLHTDGLPGKYTKPAAHGRESNQRPFDHESNAQPMQPPRQPTSTPPCQSNHVVLLCMCQSRGTMRSAVRWMREVVKQLLKQPDAAFFHTLTSSKRDIPGSSDRIIDRPVPVAVRLSHPVSDVWPNYYTYTVEVLMGLTDLYGQDKVSDYTL